MFKAFKGFVFFFLISVLSAYASGLPEDFVSVIDVNGTIMLFDTSTGKDEVTAKFQVVASQIKLKNGLTAEDQIKKVTSSKKIANEAYVRLLDYMAQWHALGELDYHEILRYDEIVKTVEEAMAATKKHKNIFPSIINYMRRIISADSQAKFVLHSFGQDTEHAVMSIVQAIPEMVVHKGSLFFNEDGYLVLGDGVFAGPSELKPLLNPGLNIWQANHRGWKKGAGGKIVWKNTSILFDDNANICARPIVGDVFDVTLVEPMMGKEIQWVDTYQALIDEDYFIRLLQSAYPDVTL
ncbi:MAG: hypothetical protein KBB83_05115 [Alphaproteobacteria bacterium]|nr:hypothetical protein [Alphaproteobacteria bacterium]